MVFFLPSQIGLFFHCFCMNPGGGVIFANYSYIPCFTDPQTMLYCLRNMPFPLPRACEICKIPSFRSGLQAQAGGEGESPPGGGRPNHLKRFKRFKHSKHLKYFKHLEYFKYLKYRKHSKYFAYFQYLKHFKYSKRESHVLVTCSGVP